MPAFGGTVAVASEYYVATNGDDGWSGTPASANAAKTDGPFATIEHARDVIRALDSASRSKAIRVNIRSGVYQIPHPIVFTPEDSGKADASITYAAYDKEHVVISGGRAITGWKRGDGHLWTAQVPAGWTFRQLFVNGVRRTRARTPDEGFFRVEGEINNVVDASKPDEPSWFTYHSEDIDPEWAQRGDVEVIALQAWADARMTIKALDPVTRRVTLGGTFMPYNREKNARYWIENTPDALDSPGEWYLDRKIGVLSYWPMPGEDMEKAQVIAPALNELVRLDGDPASGRTVHHIAFQDLAFTHADWTLAEKGYADTQAAFAVPAAITGIGAESITIDGCTIKQIGGYAIEFGMGCKSNRIVGCEMTDIGAGGVKIGEPVNRTEPNLQARDNTVSDCTIHDIGIVYLDSIGVWVGLSSGNSIIHNAIYDTNYSALSIGWSWGYGATNAHDNIIEGNLIYSIGRGMLSDLGGIYTLGEQPGTVIRGNVFHDIESWDYGGWGIYLDATSSHMLVENNLVYRTNRGGFHLHFGRDDIVRNNIFAMSGERQIIRSQAEEGDTFTFKNNIVYWSDGVLFADYALNSWGKLGYTIDENLYWRTGGLPIELEGMTNEEWKAARMDANSLVADPLFVDPSKDDYRLKPNSPASKIGFKPFDISEVGPRPIGKRD